MLMNSPPIVALQDVHVTLYLDGGHQETVVLRSDAVLLRQLLGVVMEANAQQRAKRFFQVPIRDGKGILSFTGDRLAAVVTEPPVFIQPQSTSESTVTPPPVPSSPLLKARYLHQDHFLSEADHQALLEWALQQESVLVTSTTSTNAQDYRKSLVLYHLAPQFEAIMRDRLQSVLPSILQALEIPTFPLGQIETQLTAHNNGHFYKIHNDNSTPDTTSRVLTYVYYFHREPKQFSGGQLRLYDSKVAEHYYIKSDAFHIIEPRQNSIVFFPSQYLHEVLPVYCPSGAFADSRFTINGWIRRLDTA
jgi:Rps23 Pro-64 3,4-dihydroxylase Tpa1-like proline 4-hydroxylase